MLRAHEVAVTILPALIAEYGLFKAFKAVQRLYNRDLLSLEDANTLIGSLNEQRVGHFPYKLR